MIGARHSLTDPHLLIGKDDNESEQIKFRLSDCAFEYGDFREAAAEDYGAHKYEGFLVVGSKKGDTAVAV